MNGDELLRAMSYVDERYVDEAEGKAARRSFRWQPIAAAAACLCLIVTAWNVWHPDQKAASVQLAPEAVSVQTATEAELRSMMVPELMEEAADIMREDPTAQMTIRVVSREGNMLTCIVTDPGTGSFTVDTQLRIALPEDAPRRAESAAEDAAAGAAGEELLCVVYQPAADEAEIIQAIEITPAPTEG